jgi:hypothetical protein
MQERLVTDQVVFDVLRQRLSEQLQEHPGYVGMCDPGMEPILERLNAIPGVVTVFCCSSHPEKQDFSFYVMMATRFHGLNTLTTVYDLLSRRVLAHEETRSDGYHLTMEFSTASWAWGGDLPANYKVVCIRTELHSGKHRTKFLEDFVSALNELPFSLRVAYLSGYRNMRFEGQYVGDIAHSLKQLYNHSEVILGRGPEFHHWALRVKGPGDYDLAAVDDDEFERVVISMQSQNKVTDDLLRAHFPILE